VRSADRTGPPASSHRLRCCRAFAHCWMADAATSIPAGCSRVRVRLGRDRTRLQSVPDATAILLISAITALLVAGCFAAFRGQAVEGDGVLSSSESRFCMIIEIGDTQYWAVQWPRELQLDTSGIRILNAEGAVVARVGDRIHVKGRVGPPTGDVACVGPNGIFIVDELEPAARSGEPSAGL
jgi:hypothetical protein